MVLERDDWERVDALLQAVLARPEGERAAYLDALCEGDAGLKARLVEMLRLAGSDDDLLRQGGALRGVVEVSPPPERDPGAAGVTTYASPGGSGAPPLEPGQRLGRYEIRALLGAGGMGRVYRALDPTLGREVAIKALSRDYGADTSAQRRLQREARLLATLSHPNVASIFGFEILDGAPYLILERVDGETLAARMRRRLPELDEALAIAVQIAEGLAEAHDKGVVHRDLKPSNVMMTEGGKVKLVDFGLAKTTDPAGPGEAPLTAAGMVLGTAPYMSPEQIRGGQVDQRTDIWAFGCLLFELLAGRRPFAGRTAADVLAAAQRDEPDWSALPADVPPAVRRLLRRCLRKDPHERLQHIGDARLELLELRSETLAVKEVVQAAKLDGPAPSGIPRRQVLLGAGLVLAASAGAFLAGRRSAGREPPRFHKVTYRRGYVRGARFLPDGRSIVYSAAWEGGPLKLYLKQADGPEALALDLPSANVLAVAPSGELAIALDCVASHVGVCAGTLARASVTGGAPRELAERVQQADFTRPGSGEAGLVVVRHSYSGGRLEMPPGTLLYETTGHISFPRVSPGGDTIAFFDHPRVGDDRGSVAIMDPEPGGERKLLTKEWESVRGLAWSPDGREIWFTASEVGAARSLHAVSRSGRVRTLHRSPGSLTLLDVSREGRVLVAREEERYCVSGAGPGETVERDLSWLEHSVLTGMSEDGRLILMTEQSEAVGTDYAACVRGTDGSPVVRLARGWGLSIAPDGKSILAKLPAAGAPLQFVPVGAGETRSMPSPVAECHWASWFPGGDRLLVVGNEKGEKVRLYVVDPATGASRAFTKPGEVHSTVTLTFDGRHAAVAGADRRLMLRPVDGGAAVPVRGALAGDAPMGFLRDGSLIVTTGEVLPRRLYRIDGKTGERVHWKDLMPPERAGVSEIWGAALSADAGAYAYTYRRWLSDLFLVEGLV